MSRLHTIMHGLRLRVCSTSCCMAFLPTLSSSFPVKFWLSLQLRKVKDVPRLLHRLRTTLGSVDIRDFSLLLDRYCVPYGAQGQRPQRQRRRVPLT